MFIQAELTDIYVPLLTLGEVNDWGETKSSQGEEVPLNFQMPRLTEGYTKNLRPFKIVQNEIVEAVVENRQPDLKTNVDGAVIRVNEHSVHCELYTVPNHRFVHLPISFFPDDSVKIGLPFNLRIDQISGIRRPVVQIREVAQDVLGKMAVFFDSIEF